ncbi:hypothetical protein JCM10207_001748 [Rhodosporidiobolus poonsookiae]
MATVDTLLAQAAAYPNAHKAVDDARRRSLSRPSRPTQFSPVNSYTATTAPNFTCPFSGASIPADDPSSHEALVCPATGARLPSSPSSATEAPPAPNPALAQKSSTELQQGVLFHPDDASTLYLPPLLSLLPASHPSSSSSSSSDTFDARPVNYTLSRLPSIDGVSLALHSALHAFRPLTALYSTAPYASAFNWTDLVLPTTPGDGVLEAEREFYCVVFRSRRRRDLEPEEAEELYRKDRAAHEEAVTHGGLLFYWYGAPQPLTAPGASDAHDLSGRNLATCIWSSRAAALEAMKGPRHKEAARLAGRTYESYTLERYVLRKESGERGVSVREWHGGECLLNIPPSFIYVVSGIVGAWIVERSRIPRPAFLLGNCVVLIGLFCGLAFCRSTGGLYALICILQGFAGWTINIYWPWCAQTLEGASYAALGK